MESNHIIFLRFFFFRRLLIIHCFSRLFSRPFELHLFRIYPFPQLSVAIFSTNLVLASLPPPSPSLPRSGFCFAPLAQLDLETSKARQQLKKLAAKGDIKSARILAKEVVRSNKQKDRLTMSKARLGSIQMAMQHQLGGCFAVCFLLLLLFFSLLFGLLLRFLHRGCFGFREHPHGRSIRYRTRIYGPL